MKILNPKSLILNSNSGQSLVEILIALGIGVLLIGAVATILTANLKSSFTIKTTQTVASFSQELLDSVKSWASADWHNISGLAHGSGNVYYLVVSSATSSVAVSGQESIFTNDVSAGLAGYWKLDESTGAAIYDSSGNGYTGATYGSPAQQSGINCKAAGCLNFNASSSQYAKIIPGGSLSGTFTVMAWGRPSSTVPMDLVGTRSPNEYGFDMKFFNGNTIHGDIGTGLSWITTSADANFNYSTGQWYHIAYVVTPTGYTIYANGNQIGSGSISGTPLLYDSVHSIYIGQWGGGTEYFNGNIDDVRIYNRALSAVEVAQVYNNSAYSRYFYVENVNRDTCGIGQISSNATTSCVFGGSGITDDPSTQKLTAIIKDINNNILLTEYEYLTRFRNYSFNQSNWIGGPGQNGVITQPNSQFSSSTTNVNYASGTLKLVLP